MREAAMDPKMKYSWEQAVLEAFMEFDAAQKREKLSAAENSGCGRLLQRPTDRDELLALRGAYSTLRKLFRELGAQ